MILVHACAFIWLADLLANEEIAHARVGHVVLGTQRDYHEFVETQLQVCLAGIPVTSVSFFPLKINLHVSFYAHLLCFSFCENLYVALLGFIF